MEYRQLGASVTIQIINPVSPFTAMVWPQALYLHIPFCQTHCHYCDFAVTLGTPELIEKYVAYLLREITLTPTAGQKLSTVYFGGGTPSLLTPHQLERLMVALEQKFGLLTTAEITLEINPGTVTLDSLKAYRSLGINRLSLGAQAFQDHLLKLCGRSHDVAAIDQAVRDLDRAGFTNFSLDLMFGLPQQTLADWDYSLDCALRLAPQHISAYDLILEEQTPFGRKYQLGQTPLPSEDQGIAMYLTLIEHFTKAGYEHYEIASLAQPGYQSRHNRVYWQNQSYYGLGVGATGYVHQQRVTRPRRLVDYFDWVEQGIFSQERMVTSAEELSETLMLGLRLVEGVRLAPLQDKFGTAPVAQILQALVKVREQGLIQQEAGVLKLVYPQGFLLSNEVLQCVI